MSQKFRAIVAYFIFA